MKPEFGTADWLDHLKKYDIPALNDWLVGQAMRGVEYFDARIGMLGLGGGRVLDAGCGAGNWTISLAKVFESVHAVDTDPIRLDILAGMAPRLGVVTTAISSTEELQSRDAEFDAIFCSGVVFITDCKRTLAEFSRVLKPGGKLYMSFVGEAWWRFLLLERGKTEPACVKFGADGLISLYFRRLDETHFHQSMSESARQETAEKVKKAFPSRAPSFLDSKGASLERFLAVEDVDDAFVTVMLDTVASELAAPQADRLTARRRSDAARALQTLRGPDVPGGYSRRIVRDFVSRALARRSKYEFDVHTYTYEPEDMTDLLASFGFRNIQVASEGGLHLHHQAPAAAPIYPKEHGVYETLCTLA